MPYGGAGAIGRGALTRRGLMGSTVIGIVLPLGEELDRSHLDRLARIRDLVVRREGARAADARLLLFGGAGATAEVHAAAHRGEVVLIDLDRLYSGE